MPSIRRSWPLLFLAGFMIGVAGPSSQAADHTYDPLAISRSSKAEKLDLVVDDMTRNRQIPLRVYLPAETKAAPVVLFSHGLGGSREGNPYLGEHWSARGYVAVFLQHAGSDAAVWKDVPPLQRLSALKQAANLPNTLLRLRDVAVVIDQLEQWNESAESPLRGRLDLKRLGMSGHSFGAVTTQGVSGQRTPRGMSAFTDKRIKAAIAMSPNSPKGGGDPQVLFGSVAIPWLLMTGTNDTAIVGDADVESRLAVYPALPPGSKYELVLHKGEHEAFSDRDLPGSKSKRNPNHHRVILALSTAFWDAYLKEDASARKWLDGDGPSKVLESEDRWQKK
ncbi:MAG: dienelactone hydrolase [Planctomycetaceae bacterium]|nr:dienelactone hydrolase [Planctomycetaceae bacterium]